MQFTRFLRNKAVTASEMAGHAAERTATRVAGRDIVVVQDTSELALGGRRAKANGYGPVGKGGALRGLLLHAVLAVDAGNGAVLGLVDAPVRNRSGGKVKSRRSRTTAQKESQRWLDGTVRAGEALAAARSITGVSDRESDIYELFAAPRPAHVHLLVRAAQDRRLWVEINAYKDGKSIYQSGAVPEGAGPTELTSDPDFWLFRDCLFDADGHETHDFWNATTYESNSLPGQLTFDPSDRDFYRSHVYQFFPRRTGQMLSDYPDRVTMRVQLEAFPRDLFDDLFASPADHGLTNDQVAAMRAKLPRFTIGKELEWTPAAVADTAHGGQTYYEMNIIPVDCVTNTAMAASADKVPATNHTMCAP